MSRNRGPSPSRFTSRDLALVAVFVGIMAALGLVPALHVFGNAVPITAQSMGPMLAGAIIGSRRGCVSMAVCVLLVAMGLPLLAGNVGGLGMFATPRVGFLVGFPVAALVVGLLTERFGPSYSLLGGLVANAVGGIAALYVFGVAGIMLVGQVGIDAAATSVAVFIPGDLVKVAVAALVARGVHAGYPGLLPGRRRDERQPTPV